MSKPTQEGSPRKKQKIGHKIRLRRYFITGLLVIVPMGGTYLILKTLLVMMEGVLGNFMKSGDLYYIPGFGILLLLALIFFAGLFTTNVFGRKLFNLWEKLLSSVPLVKNVYSMVKSLVDTLSMQAGENKNFSRVVLIEYPRSGLFTYGFVTGEMDKTIERVSKGKALSIFIPTVPNPISGFLILVPEGDVIPLTLTVEDGMKIVFSVGLYRPELEVDESQVPKVIEEGSA
ncbi:MAG: DUF502 domain-containing protein [Nitrospirae bacterium]|nr:DUF502 domain-containing protein [Candidatus Manganitrophaceae bacterium]